MSKEAGCPWLGHARRWLVTNPPCNPPLPTAGTLLASTPHVTDCLRLLIDGGASVNVRCGGATPLMGVILGADPDVADPVPRALNGLLEVLLDAPGLELGTVSAACAGAVSVTAEGLARDIGRRMSAVADRLRGEVGAVVAVVGSSGTFVVVVVVLAVVVVTVPAVVAFLLLLLLRFVAAAVVVAAWSMSHSSPHNCFLCVPRQPLTFSSPGLSSLPLPSWIQALARERWSPLRAAWVSIVARMVVSRLAAGRQRPTSSDQHAPIDGLSPKRPRPHRDLKL
jgi:hypothetical protein